MFPDIFEVLIVASVILMILWEFSPLIKAKLLPFSMGLFPGPAEVKPKPLIYLADSPLEDEFLSLTNLAKNELWFGFPHVMEESLTTFLNNVDTSCQTKLILGRKSDPTQIKETVKQLDVPVEIINRPRIHFKVLLTESSVAVGSANFSSEGLEALRELVIISTNQRLVEEVRSYFFAFYNKDYQYPPDGQMYSLSSALPGNTKSVFVNTSNGLNDLIYALLYSAKKSVILVSPHITNDVAEQIINSISDQVQIRFITWLNWRQWANGQSDPEALEMLLSNRVLIEACSKLHANCIIVDGKAAIVSSQNLTTESWSSRDEAGIYTRNPDLIQDLLERIEDWQPRRRLTLQVLEAEIGKFDSYMAKESEKIYQLPDRAEDEEFPIEIGETTSPPLLGFTDTMKPELESPEVPAPDEVLKPTEVLDSTDVEIPAEIPVEAFWLEDVVFVGKKRTMDYVWACIFQAKKKGSVTIRARGRLIYRAVEVAELLRNKFMPDLALSKGAIQIDTYYPKGRKKKWGGISEIEITLSRSH